MGKCCALQRPSFAIFRRNGAFQVNSIILRPNLSPRATFTFLSSKMVNFTSYSQHAGWHCAMGLKAMHLHMRFTVFYNLHV